MNEEAQQMNAINDKLDSLAEKAAEQGELAMQQQNLIGKNQAKVENATDRICEQDKRLKAHIAAT